MNIREAILRAADHIEGHPGLWRYFTLRVPDCGTPGCALGWIGHFMGSKAGTDIDKVAEAMGLAPLYSKQHEQAEVQWAFYQRINDVLGRGSIFESSNFLANAEASQVASALRLYADKYHPAPKVHGIPESVRAIFETKQTEAAIQSFL